MNGTFSINSQRGPRLRRTSRNTSSTRPERNPVMPAVRPACDRSWQGKPAATSSVPAGTARRAVMSACRSVSGKRAPSTACAPGSISQSSSQVQPCAARPSSSPPIPANNPTIRPPVTGHPFCDPTTGADTFALRARGTTLLEPRRISWQRMGGAVSSV
ncbi:Uncharacterised protein [Mycobacteroides abscessus subsp. abscessus]|nr:Uncharacterised protein [Mycobacteroides abscessus subsp. abscessus]